ncbi:hypothetical protein EXN32_12420 [Agrobacterium tumefaciens]|uniref:hypothetical protein n=1 Tax=Agrobacterium TaxID=357 RepID=UPI00115D3AC4|nr:MULTISPECIES: hypothetical protein [Agrobacterium]MDA5243100.1 hypothetical protein [Agrobacterium sp. MAFF310724]MDA5247348.1 hypothetical protein [Agrobacterium sp. MAFF210268]TRB16292.1 hypothetical protein EXN32_12420 [Agrobacterium tumefaciens]
MGSINLTYRQIEAIKGVNERELNKAIEQCIREEQSTAIDAFPLSSCGEYVRNKLRHFERDLQDYERARSTPKRDEALRRLRNSGEDLWGSFVDMHGRMENEEKHHELFFIDDDIYTPSHFDRNISVDLNYKWRKQVSDDWNHGSIKFRHRHDPWSVYPPKAIPKRKPSKAQEARKLQEELLSTWEHLRDIALYTLRDFFEAGGEGSSVPESVKAVPAYGGHLNNASVDFWGKFQSKRG